MTRRFILSFTLLMVFTGMAFAQPNERREEMREKMKSIKIAFMTSELELTPDESKVFWPLYEEHENKIESMRKAIRPDKSEDELTDEEAKNLLKAYFKMEKDKLKLDEEFVQQLMPILGPQRIIRMRKSDEKFKRKLLERSRENRGGKGRYGGRGE